MTTDQPQFPLTVEYSDGTTVTVNSTQEAAENLEWLNTDEVEDPVQVVDKLGRKVRLRIEFLEVKKLTLEPTSPRSESNETSVYQEIAVPRLKKVLDKHGLQTAVFKRADKGERPLVATFVWNDKEHEIEIFENSVAMTSEKRLFEIFLKEEFGTPEIEIASFAKRLHRYLGGGEW